MQTAAAIEARFYADRYGSASVALAKLEASVPPFAMDRLIRDTCEELRTLRYQEAVAANASRQPAVVGGEVARCAA